MGERQERLVLKLVTVISSVFANNLQLKTDCIHGKQTLFWAGKSCRPLQVWKKYFPCTSLEGGQSNQQQQEEELQTYAFKIQIEIFSSQEIKDSHFDVCLYGKC